MEGRCVKVGCCGFPYSMKKYFERFNLVEVQKTFYRIPSLRVLERWRSSAPPGFEFTLKAWQVITHPSTSPTWRKAGLKIDDRLADRYGYLRPTPENLEAWSLVVEAAETLESRIIVVQTPPGFGYSKENYNNALGFFAEARRISPRMIIAWEPRGTWHERREELRKLLEITGVIHVTDILRHEPIMTSDAMVYTRLHGLGGREVNYRYRYSDNDLARLHRIAADMLRRVPRVYVLFNNVYMGEDAARFEGLLAEHRMLCG